MPWEKTFDTDDVIARAIKVFWHKGYAASSMADLTKAMGINKGSLYNAFGSKKKLFVRALQQYDRDRTQRTLSKMYAKEAPLDAINGLFDHVINHNCSNPDNKGCLLVNTALDFPHHDADIQKMVTKSLDNLKDFFEANIIRGQSDGSIPAHIDPQTTAHVLRSLIVGLQVLSRGASDPGAFEAVKVQVIDMLRG
ncbi:MAG: TetR/AcrR family transcriptional regulator [Amylibacter sp.]|nr:TetR/AcrR family transcriptional regulator [Amylibacter sp.]